MSSNAIYDYVVLRLSPDVLRGECINVGLAIFPEEGEPIVRITAPVGKVAAIDPTWDRIKELRFQVGVEKLVGNNFSATQNIESLEKLGYCKKDSAGFFYSTPSGMESEIRNLTQVYIANKLTRENRQRRSKLHKEVSDRFKSMDILGTSPDDLGKHRVVPHLPIPGNPDLKGDFVYKNGVYRITQTLDYRVSAMGAHQKVSEACTKVMAAAEGSKAWGQETKKFALVCVPSEIENIADAHLDLLYASGFEIFHADNPRDFAKYHNSAFSH